MRARRMEPSKLTVKTRSTEISGGCEEEEEPPLSPNSNIMFQRKGLNVHVVALLGFKSKVDVNVFKANLPNTLLKHPRFSSIVVGDHSKGEKLRWVRQENVDPLDHIVVPKIGPEAVADPDKYLQDYVCNLSKSNVDRSKPLWEMHIINLKTSHSESTIIFRIHHSLGDGPSLISLLMACTRRVADPTAVPTVPTALTHKRGRVKQCGTSRWRRLLVAIWMMVTLLWNTAVDVAAFIATSIYLKDTVTPLSGVLKKSEYAPRRIVLKTVNLNDIKLIKNAFNGTINDVLLGVTQAGISRYLNRKYGDNEKQNNLPANIRLRSAITVNTRPSAGIQALADMMENNTKARWGNCTGYLLLPFSIALRDDPLDYVRVAKAIVDRKKHSLEALLTFYISEISYKLFGAKKAGVISHTALCNTTLIFSNVVGPMEEIKFFGYTLQFIAPTVYGLPHALMVYFLSYVDKLTIVLSVDEDTIPDASNLCNDIVDSLTLIKEEVITNGLAQ